MAWRRFDDIPGDAQIPWLIGVGRNALRNAPRKQRRINLLEARLRPIDSDAPAEDYVIADEGPLRSVRSARTNTRY